MSVRGPYDSQSNSSKPRTLGERIKMFRVLRGLTQVELGEALNSDQATVSLWERDRAKPSGPALSGIASYFGTTPLALETGKGLALPDSDEPTRRPAPGKGPLGLPDSTPGGALAMDLRLQSQQQLEPMEAMGFLMKALKEGRSVWIVAD